MTRRSQLEALERRDWQLWLIALVLILALLGTLIASQALRSVEESEQARSQQRVYLVGLSLLVLLFCAYVVQTLVTVKRLRSHLSDVEDQNTRTSALLETLEAQATKLRESEENYCSLLAGSVEALVLTDMSGEILFVNPAAEVLFGRSAEDLLGGELPVSIPAGEDSELEIRRPDGSRRSVETTLGEALWQGRQAQLVSLRDVTARRESERTLREANEELKRLNEMKSAFVSTVSHELRTPLTAIKNATHLLVSGKAGENSAHQLRFLQMVARNIDRLSAIVDDLLDLSRIEAGRIEYHFQTVKVLDVIRSITETFRPQADEAGISLLVECEETLPPVHADQQRVEQILCNLLSNALKFTPRGGKVRVEVHDRGDEVGVSVIDTGVGIPESEQAKAFEPFGRIESQQGHRTKGTGLGLAITRDLVSAHGGTITVRSSPGKGSCFRFSLLPATARAGELLELEAVLRKHAASGSVAVIVIDMRSPDTAMAEDVIADTLKRLEKVVRTVVQRKKDRVLRQVATRRLAIVLPETPREGASVVLEKIAEARRMHRDDAASRTGGEHTTACSVAVFPEDGTSARDLLDAMTPRLMYEGGACEVDA